MVIRRALLLAFAVLVLGSSPALAAPPANDNFANAQLLPATASVPGTTVESTREPGEPVYYDLGPDGPSANGDASVWYAWTAPRSARFRVATCGSSELTSVVVFSGPGFGGLTFVRPETPNADLSCPFGDKGQAHLFEAVAGTTYHIAVVNVSFGHYGPFQLTLAEPPPPPVIEGGITQTATRKVVKSGGTVTYTTTLRNLGTVAIETELLLIAVKNRSYDPARKVQVLKVRTTRGRCARHPNYKGSVCTIGRLEPGQTAVVTATLRLRESIIYYGELQDGQGQSPDATRSNNERYTVTRVRR